jgi:hypothetical protein
MGATSVLAGLHHVVKSEQREGPLAGEALDHVRCAHGCGKLANTDGRAAEEDEIVAEVHLVKVHFLHEETNVGPACAERAQVVLENMVHEVELPEEFHVGLAWQFPLRKKGVEEMALCRAGQMAAALSNQAGEGKCGFHLRVPFCHM